MACVSLLEMRDHPKQDQGGWVYMGYLCPFRAKTGTLPPAAAGGTVGQNKSRRI
jgi:hypothetical protein